MNEQLLILPWRIHTVQWIVTGNVELLEALQRKIIEAKKLKSEVKICFINIVAAGLLELSPFVLRLVQRFGQG